MFSPITTMRKVIIARSCPKPRVRDSKYFQEQMLLAKKDEADIPLNYKENDFLLADASEIEEFEDLIDIVNSGQVDHYNNDYDQRRAKTESLFKTMRLEIAKQQKISQEVKQSNVLLTKEIETYKERIQEFESKSANKTDFQKEYPEAIQREKKLDH
nr:hypothetical protein [Tanacetum cinerariifolium]